MGASPAAKAFVLQTKPRTLKPYTDGRGCQTYRFPRDVVFAQFSGGGRRRLVLTRDQTAYILALPAPGPPGR